jgi:hypothetical protein
MTYLLEVVVSEMRDRLLQLRFPRLKAGPSSSLRMTDVGGESNDGIAGWIPPLA